MNLGQGRIVLRYNLCTYILKSRTYLFAKCVKFFKSSRFFISYLLQISSLSYVWTSTLYTVIKKDFLELKSFPKSIEYKFNIQFKIKKRNEYPLEYPLENDSVEFYSLCSAIFISQYLYNYTLNCHISGTWWNDSVLRFVLKY